ncbi:MAG: hypothetical protein FJZ43_03850 [Candidatus Staskawiczbacteria bacterium]|nr:hypothetical protein [Candidatus Staskawiczbacteria bacterium]
MQQYPIPQFIEEEGKIVFFLTFKQFFLLIGGGAVCLILYYTLPFIFFVLTALPIVLLVGAVAFIKIENESVVSIFMHFIGFSMANKNYIWKKKELYHPPNTELGKKSKVEEIKKTIETKR